MPKQLEALMWEQACDAMERADRLYRQFFHRSRATPAWEAPCDIFESEETLTILIALPGVELDQIEVTLSAGVLIVSGVLAAERDEIRRTFANQTFVEDVQEDEWLAFTIRC